MKTARDAHRGMSLGHGKLADLLDLENADSELPPSKKAKSVHYSSMQNKPIDYSCLEDLSNRLMLDIDIPRYFCLDQSGEENSSDTK